LSKKSWDFANENKRSWEFTNNPMDFDKPELGIDHDSTSNTWGSTEK
jgi:hypothetical protein